MLRTALFISGLVGLLATTTLAAPAEHTATSWWRPRGFRSHRASQGDYVPVYASYRNRTQYGLFGFLHHSAGARHHSGSKHTSHPHQSGRHTLGIF